MNGKNFLVNAICSLFLTATVILSGCTELLPIEEADKDLMTRSETTEDLTVENIHAEIYSIDTHCDTPMNFNASTNIGNWGSNKVDIPKMQAGLLDATFMVAYLQQYALTDATRQQKAIAEAESTLKEIIRQVEMNSNKAGIALSTDDLKLLKADGKRAIFLGLENGYAIGNDLKNIEKFANMGVRYITLVHNGHNLICDSHTTNSLSNPAHNGVSAFGKEVIKEMDRLGIMIDISHASEKSSLDAVELSKHPIIASHSSAKALCNNSRNISDNLMKAIAKKGGVVQVCLLSGFLKSSGTATVKDAVAHINHIVQTVGIDHVGIGSDFDGGGGISGANDASELANITAELMNQGYSKEEIAKIWGGNLMRVMDIVAGTTTGTSTGIPKIW